MLLEIEPAVFDAPDHGPVISVLTMVAKRRHDWRPSVAAATRAEEFVGKLTAAELRIPAVAEWAAKAVEEAAYPHVDGRQPVRITVSELEQTVADLEQSAVLVVENRVGDGGFVRRVAAALDDLRILEALDKVWLRFCNGGGCADIPAQAAEERKSFHLVIRVAALFDSDRRNYGQASPNEDKVRKTGEAGITEIHLLTWRMMENYLPFRVWEHHFPTRSHKITHLRGLLPQQRGYLHLKHHFVGRNGRMPTPLIPDSVELTETDFAELGPDVVRELRELLAMIHRIL